MCKHTAFHLITMNNSKGNIEIKTLVTDGH